VADLPGSVTEDERLSLLVVCEKLKAKLESPWEAVLRILFAVSLPTCADPPSYVAYWDNMEYRILIPIFVAIAGRRSSSTQQHPFLLIMKTRYSLES